MPFRSELIIKRDPAGIVRKHCGRIFPNTSSTTQHPPHSRHARMPPIQERRWEGWALGSAREKGCAEGE